MPPFILRGGVREPGGMPSQTPNGSLSGKQSSKARTIIRFFSSPSEMFVTSFGTDSVVKFFLGTFRPSDPLSCLLWPTLS